MRGRSSTSTAGAVTRAIAAWPARLPQKHDTSPPPAPSTLSPARTPLLLSMIVSEPSKLLIFLSSRCLLTATRDADNCSHPHEGNHLLTLFIQRELVWSSYSVSAISIISQNIIELIIFMILFALVRDQAWYFTTNDQEASAPIVGMSMYCRVRVNYARSKLVPKLMG